MGWKELMIMGVMVIGCHVLHANEFEKVIKQVNDPQIVEAANFAMHELQKLSDTGIYQTLSLVKIESASTQIGHFHFNTFLQLEIACPHYQSKKPTEIFQVIVLRNNEDMTQSFAIDNFPVMDEDAIENFWIEMVERNRKARREIFAEWGDIPQKTDSSMKPASLNVDLNFLKDEL